MSTSLTIQLPAELEQRLMRCAERLNLPLESFILQSLHQLVQEEDTDTDPENESKASILAGLRTALQEVRDGKVHPIEELWNGIDD